MTDAGATPSLVIDTLGKHCPVPVIELARQIDSVAVGEVVEVRSDDAGSRVDIPVWCRMKGHDYAGAVPLERGVGYLVRRGH
jgi:cysteine desulfurase